MEDCAQLIYAGLHLVCLDEVATALLRGRISWHPATVRLECALCSGTQAQAAAGPTSFGSENSQMGRTWLGLSSQGKGSAGHTPQAVWRYVRSSILAQRPVRKPRLHLTQIGGLAEPASRPSACLSASPPAEACPCPSSAPDARHARLSWAAEARRGGTGTGTSPCCKHGQGGSYPFVLAWCAGRSQGGTWLTWG